VGDDVECCRAECVCDARNRGVEQQITESEWIVDQTPVRRDRGRVVARRKNVTRSRDGFRTRGGEGRPRDARVVSD
jgi:hypothetical protein